MEVELVKRKPVLLFSGAREIPLVFGESRYDEDQRLTMSEDGVTPLVSTSPSPATESKTMQAPGDDDPDPQDERCY